MNSRKRSVTLCALVFSLLATQLLTDAQTLAEEPKRQLLDNPRPERILFIGNSYFYYNDSLHNHVSRLVNSLNADLGDALTYKSATIGGATLDHHPIDSYLKQGQLGLDEPFQLVILQGGSGEALGKRQRERFSKTATAFIEKITSTGAEAALYMTHAYVPPHRRHDPNMLREIETLYVETANNNDALVIPVGLAFEEAYRRDPKIQLHKSFDGSHPSLLGTYLAACVVVASIYDISPVGSDYDYFGEIDSETARFLQTIAVDTVQQFFNRE